MVLANGTNQAVVNAGKAIAGPQQFDGQAVHRFMTDAGDGNLGGAAYDALGAAASIAPIAATAAVPYLGPAVLAVQGAGNTIAAREQATGESAPSTADALAGTASAALNLGLGPASAGVMRFVAPTLGKIGNTLGARALLRTALAGGAGATTGAGNYALDTAGTGNMTGAGALNAAVEGAGTGTLAGATNGVMKTFPDTVAAMMQNSKVGAPIRAYAAETAPWNNVYQQAYTGIKAGNPNLPEDQLADIASMQAQRAGATPPTFDTLSPAAQRGLAQLGVLQMYQQRLQLATQGSGKSPNEIDKSTIFKDVLGDITRDLKTTSAQLQAAGKINPAQASDLNDAIKEAQQGNRNPAQGGEDLGYFDTLQDRVNQLPIDPAHRNTIAMMLRMADEAEDNSWKQASMGPFERNASKIGGLAGALGAVTLGGHMGLGADLALDSLEGFGGLMGMSKNAGIRAALRSVDKIAGLQLPPILRNQGAIEQYAQQKGLTNPATPGDLREIQQSLQMDIPSPAQALINRAALRNQAVLDAAGLRPQTVDQGTTGPAESAAVELMRRKAQAVNTMAQGPQARVPMARLSRPGPPPAQPSRAGTPAAPQGPTGPVGQIQAMQAALQARQAANDAPIMKAFPIDGTVWQNSIADKTGLPVKAIQDHLQGLADSGTLPQDVHSSISAQQYLPPDQFGRLHTYFANMARGQGVTPPGPNPVPQGPLGAGVDPNAAIRYAKYRAATQTANTVHANIAAQNPDLAPIANVIAGTKVAEDRAAVLDHYLSGITDPAAKARVEAILRPLTVFGWKPSSGSPDPRTNP